MTNSWWRQASFYQIYPRSFMDSNNDGEGDLQGVIARIPYLKSLGIDAVWLSPFYPSPLADGGYDVADPRNVDPRFGSLSDFDEMVAQLHEAGIKVVVDVVPNHVSVEHRWFKPLLAGTATPEDLARFHIRNGVNGGPPNNWISVFGGSAWSQLPDGRYYLHLFDSSQPDLNWDNQEVIDDGLATLKFWLDRGVDGFRVDVAFGLKKDMTYANHHDPQGLINAMRLDLFDPERDPNLPNPREVLLGGPFFDRDEVHEIYRGWRILLNQYSPERMTVAEAWAYPASRAMDYARSDELHQVFNFDFMVTSYKVSSIVASINEVLKNVSSVQAPATWVLTNHDSSRVVTRLGGGDTGRAKAKVFAAIAHALPGGVYVYQGEELGLDDADISDADRQDPIFFRTHGAEVGRDGSRVPLPWMQGEKNYGFSRADSLWLPQPKGWKSCAADAQDSAGDSTLNFYRSMLHIRKLVNTQESENSFEWIESPIVSFRRGSTLAVYANPADGAVSLPVGDSGDIVVAAGAVALIEEVLHLGAHSAVWLLVR